MLQCLTEPVEVILTLKQSGSFQPTERTALISQWRVLNGHTSSQTPLSMRCSTSAIVASVWEEKIIESNGRLGLWQQRTDLNDHRTLSLFVDFRVEVLHFILIALTVKVLYPGGPSKLPNSQMIDGLAGDNERAGGVKINQLPQSSLYIFFVIILIIITAAIAIIVGFTLSLFVATCRGLMGSQGRVDTTGLSQCCQRTLSFQKRWLLLILGKRCTFRPNFLNEIWK